MLLSYIITGKDSRVHVITPQEQITTSVLKKLKSLGCFEVAIRSSENIPEKDARITTLQNIRPVSMARRSAESISDKMEKIQLEMAHNLIMDYANN